MANSSNTYIVHNALDFPILKDKFKFRIYPKSGVGWAEVILAE